MVTIPIVYGQFLEDGRAFKGYTSTTVESMTSALSQFLKMMPERAVDDLTTHVMKSWIRKGRCERNWSAKTIRLYLTYFNQFGKWCETEGLLPTNPVEEIERPRLPQKLPKCLSEEECQKILDWTKNFPFFYKFERMRGVAIICTFLGTGIRKRELVNLKMEDVDMVRRELIVRQGKGQKDRKIPFRPSLAKILEDYLKDRRRLKRACPYFFTSLKQDTQMGDGVFKSLFPRIRKKAGIHFYPHLLRHTYATRMLESGFHVREVQELMGHASIETTAMYVTVTAQRLREQVALRGLDV